MELLLGHLRATADYVVIDTPPALVVTDAMIVAPRVDGVVVVVDSDVTTGAAALHTVEQLEQVGAKVIGSVLNRFDPSKARYYSRGGRMRLPLPLRVRGLRRGRQRLERQGPARTSSPDPRRRLALARRAGSELRAARTDPGRRHR